MALSTLVLASEGAEHSTFDIMMQTLPAGIIAVAAFFLLAMVTLSYRNVANRHAPKAKKFAEEHGEHGAGH